MKITSHANVLGSSEDFSDKVQEMQEMQEIQRDRAASPKKRKSEEFDSDMETMAAGSDVEMD